MAEIHNRIVDHPSAWTSRRMGSIDRFVYRLHGPQLEAIDELLRNSRSVPPQQVTRREFDHPLLNPMLADMFGTIVNGRGVVVVRGITPDRYSEEDFERIHWGFGTHWGIAVMPDAANGAIEHITREPSRDPAPDDPRGSAVALHTDFHDITALMCVQRGARGGLSRVASALAAHNEILATRPELLAPLYRGYFYASYGLSSRVNPVTSYLIPVFSCAEAKVSCAYYRRFMSLAAANLGELLSPDLVEALDYLDAVAQRDDMSFRFMLEPGEMLICNNFVTLHGRTEFEDSAREARRLLRLWLDAPGSRPVIPALVDRAADYGRIDI